MSYFKKDSAAYSKLELDSNHPIPAVYHEKNNLNKIPSIPSTTYSSRFEERLYPILSNEEYHQFDTTSHLLLLPSTTKPTNRKTVANS